MPLGNAISATRLRTSASRSALLLRAGGAAAAPGRVAPANRAQATGLANRSRTDLGRLGRPATEFAMHC